MSFADEVTALYKQYSKIVTVESGSIVSTNPPVLQIGYKQRDINNFRNRSFVKTFVKSNESFSTIPGFSTELSESIILSSVSPSGKYKIYFKKKLNAKEGEETYIIELWSAATLISHIPTGSVHGKVLNDGYFTAISWSSDEKAFLYEAEGKAKNKKKFFEPKEPATSGASPAQSEETDPFNFADQENWGEGLFMFKTPRLYICNLDDESVAEVKGIPNHLAISCARFAPGDDGIVFVGYDIKERRLGLKYCYQRPNMLYLLRDFDRKKNDSSTLENILAENEWNAIRPIFSPNGKYLIYMTSGKVAYHHSCYQIVIVEWSKNKEDRKKRVLVDIVDKPAADEFTGVYSTDFHSKCWDEKNASYLIINSSFRSVESLFTVRVQDGKVTRILPRQKNNSLSLLDHTDGNVLAVEQSPSCPYQLIYGKINPETLTVDSWTEIENADATLPPSIKEKLQGIKSDVFTVEAADKSGETFECILLKPKQATNVPLIVFPHGGPHSVFPTSFAYQSAFLCILGYAVLQINYRGSVGFGQSSVRGLPGKCGFQDVLDVQTAAEVVASQGWVDKSRIAVMGGSHGGFLTAHMIGQYPEYYRCGIMRNPVTNIPSMVTTTDIPDWCFIESGFDPYEHIVVDGEMLKQMYEASPIAHVKKVKAPTLIMLGEVDLRVPMSQGREYYNVLKARKVETKLMLYPQNAHPLDKIDAEADSIYQTAVFLNKHC